MTEKELMLEAQEKLIIEIRRRFRYPVGDIKKGLQSYELELVYQAFPKISKGFINSAIRSLKYGKFKALIPQTDQKNKREDICRGVIQATTYYA